MSKLEQFVSVVHSLDGLADAYREMRLYMKNKGYTNQEIERMYSIPYELMTLRYKVQDEMNDFKNSARSYGFKDDIELFKIMSSIIEPIDREIPLDD